MNKTHRRSPIALAVLALLYEEPMHPYRMQQLIKERGKDKVINVRQRASLYQTIERLLKADLIRVQETTRRERWPERTIYVLTDDGRQATLQWMREMLATPTPEFPEFPAALSQIALLTPDDVLSQLEKRAEALEQEITDIEEELVSVREFVPRLFLVEMEYLRAIQDTELAWVQSLIHDLRSGKLTWTEWSVRQHAEEGALRSRAADSGQREEEEAMGREA
jgi:DNA-binding PadR family transcriptional regulator